MNEQYLFEFPEIQVDDKAMSLRIDQIMGMILKYIRLLAEKNYNVVIKECTITVPSHWEFPIRRLLADAGEIAGMKVLQIINELTAAATYFGLDKAGNES